MSVIKISTNEIREQFKTRLMRVSMLAIAAIPLIYGALYLWAFWNPYSRLSDLPMAVVNQDQGFGDANFGNELVSNLKEKPVLKWEYVTQEEADAGLKDHHFYGEINIPKNFSEQILSVSTDNPQKAQIIYIARENNSMIGAQITNRVTSEVADSLNHTIIKSYQDQIFAKMHDSALSIKEAADGSLTLSSGLKTAEYGTGQLTDGTSKIYNGSLSLTSGLKSAYSGSQDLTQGLGKLEVGASDLQSGISRATDGASAGYLGSLQLKSGIDLVSDGVNQLIINISSTTSNLSTVKAYLADPSTTINDATSPFNGMTKLMAANYIVNSIITQSTSEVSLKKVSDLQTGLTQLEIGSASLTDGLSTLSRAMSNNILSGSKQLTSGIATASKGSASLQQGLGSAISGSQSLTSGLGQLTVGASDLNKGIASAQTGADTLGSSLSQGAEEALKSSDISLTSKLSSVMSSPIELKNQSINTVPNYGTGFVPYFVPLSLWVGALILFQIVKPNEVAYKGKLKRTQVILAKTLNCLIMGTIQALVLDLVLIKLLGLTPVHLGYFIGFTIMTAWTFMVLVQLLVSVLGDVGKFLGIVFLMLQLTSAGGTYPLQTAPNFFQGLSNYLPMTHIVSGLREIVSGDNLIFANRGMLIMVLIMLVTMALNLLLNRKVYRVSEKNIIGENELIGAELIS